METLPTSPHRVGLETVLLLLVFFSGTSTTVEGAAAPATVSEVSGMEGYFCATSSGQQLSSQPATGSAYEISNTFTDACESACINNPDCSYFTTLPDPYWKSDKLDHCLLYTGCPGQKAYGGSSWNNAGPARTYHVSRTNIGSSTGATGTPFVGTSSSTTTTRTGTTISGTSDTTTESTPSGATTGTITATTASTGTQTLSSLSSVQGDQRGAEEQMPPTPPSPEELSECDLSVVGVEWPQVCVGDEGPILENVCMPECYPLFQNVGQVCSVSNPPYVASLDPEWPAMYTGIQQQLASCTWATPDAAACVPVRISEEQFKRLDAVACGEV